MSVNRWAGAAGVGFGVSVVIQNLWAGAAGINPDPDASAADVLEKFAQHGDANAVLLGWVAVNLVLLGLFLAGAHERLRTRAPVWSRFGFLGGILLMGFFTLVNVPRAALALGADAMGGELALVDALWHFHNAAFAFAGLSLGMALLGFSLAALDAGLLPSWFRVVGPVGAAVIMLSSVPVQAFADGSPATMIGLLGFLAWLLFLIVFGLRLWNEVPERVAA